MKKNQFSLSTEDIVDLIPPNFDLEIFLFPSAITQFHQVNYLILLVTPYKLKVRASAHFKPPFIK